eukprot:5054659-Pleurochrysis_carterae.AAC.1
MQEGGRELRCTAVVSDRCGPGAVGALQREASCYCAILMRCGAVVGAHGAARRRRALAMSCVVAST